MHKGAVFVKTGLFRSSVRFWLHPAVWSPAETKNLAQVTACSPQVLGCWGNAGLSWFVSLVTVWGGYWKGLVSPMGMVDKRGPSASLALASLY